MDPATESKKLKKEKKDREKSAVEGGLARGTLRVAIPKLIKSISKMKFHKVKVPKLKLKIKVPAKVIGNVSDKMGHVMDFVGAVKDSDEVKESKWKTKLVKSVKNVGPSYVSSVVLGITLFGIYETASAKIAEKTANHWTRHLNPCLAGSLAGAGYGTMNYCLALFGPKVIPFWPQKDRIFLASTVLSNVLTHCAMFSTYEYTKRSTVHLTDSKLNDAVGVTCVIFAAICAGVTHEYLTELFSSMETLKLTDLKSVRLCRPSVKEMFSPGIIIGSIIGFLAFEYSKEQVGELE